MKWFFVGLLVANIALLVWNGQQNRQASSVAGETAGIDAPGLVLLSELGASPPVRTMAGTTLPVQEAEAAPDASAHFVAESSHSEQPGAAPEDIPVVAVHCVRLGGFDSPLTLARVAGSLRQAGTDVRGQGEETGDIRRYWVMLPPYAKAAAATPVLERLQRAGIKDFYLIRSGDNVNAISLGVYSSADSAQRRLRQIRDLKLAPKIEEITLPAKRWWLEFEWPAERNDAAWRAVLPGEDRDITVQSCR